MKNILLPVFLSMETPNDEKGNNNGILHGGVTPTTDRFGNHNSAYEFDGTSGYITFSANDADLKYKNFTVSCWVNVAAIPPQSSFSPLIMIGGKRILVVGKGEYSSTDFKWVANVQNNISDRIAYTENYYSNDYNQWKHIVMKRAGDSLKLYVNGEFKSFGMGFFDAGYISNSINYIGASINNSSYFHGKIDDVKIFKGALNDNEIYSLFTEQYGQCDYQQDIIPEQISCFPFNGDANDNIGINNGTIIDASLTSDRFGNSYSAYLFNGVSSKITFPTTSYHNLQYSYSAWVFPLSIPALGTTYKIIDIGSGSQIQSIHLDEYQKCVMTSAGRSPITTQSSVSSTSLSIQLNQWSHIVSVRTLNEDLIYINGLLQSRKVHNSSVDYSSNPIGRIGASINNSSYFHGKIDDVKIFKGALNAGEVKALYEQSSSSICNFTHCPINRFITSPISSATNYSRFKLITVKNIASGSPIELSSGGAIILYPGFETMNNVLFKAQIKGCKID